MKKARPRINPPRMNRLLTSRRYRLLRRNVRKIRNGVILEWFT